MAGGHSLNFVQTIVGSDLENLASGVLSFALVSVAGIAAAKKLKSKENPLVPDEKLTMNNFFELVAQFVLSLGDGVMGKHNRKYLPFVGTLFIYILISNLLGLVPGFSGPTDSFKFNLGVALVIFVLYNVWGVKEVGLVNYLKHFLGPVLLMAPLMIIIEIVSHIARPLSLSLRLFGNMTGDHLVLAVFTDLTKLIVPVLFYGLGTFVCFMQAFVFMMLTMIYIRLAVAHEEH